MRVINQTTETVALDRLQPHPRNPRQGDVGAIYESIEANGFYGTIIAQKSTGFILAGSHRWAAAQYAGATEVPVTFVDVDDATALRILLADNRANDLASYDSDALASLLVELQQTTHSLTGTGYDGQALDDLLADLNRQEFAPTLNPTLEATTVQAADVDAAREKLGEQFRGERALRETMCPNCGHEFYID